MEDKENIDRLIEETIEAASSIKRVDTPPFFKDKLLKRLNGDKETGVPNLWPAWFNPRYQAAALICFIFLNAYALATVTSDDYDENVENFAQEFGITGGERESYFNLN